MVALKQTSDNPTVNRERVALLVEALRSGEFQQGKHVLRRGSQFCCLGVACEVFRSTTGTGRWVRTTGATAFVVSGTGDPDDNQTHTLPPSVSAWFGFGEHAHNPTVTAGGKRFALSNLNDLEGLRFPAIADAIERTFLAPAVSS
jgi:hypothetical protein